MNKSITLMASVVLWSSLVPSTVFARQVMALAPSAAPVAASGDLVAALERGKFTTLSAAIDAAGLADTLRGSGPFTIFAPTEEAFAALPAGTIESLLRPENKKKLREILLHHVVSGRLSSFEVGNIDAFQMARTALGDRLPINADRKGFRFGDATVVRADMAASNGVIHAIDRVLIPMPPRTAEVMAMAMKEAAPVGLLDALRAVPDGRYSTFIAAVEASGGDQDWAQAEPQGNWTLFVPTNDAFARLGEKVLATLLAPKNLDTLRALLDWHALPKLQPWGFDFRDRQRGVAMVSEQDDRFVLDIIENGMVFVYTLRSAGVDRAAEEPFKARIVAGDIGVGGNLVHVVDRVIVPQSLEGSVIPRQAYRERDVKELVAGASAQFGSVDMLRRMLQDAAKMDEAAAVSLYRLGLQTLEEVVPVSRTGVMIMREANDAASLRARLAARIDDLDRVWYGTFMKNSPAATSLDVPLPDSSPGVAAGMPASAEVAKAAAVKKEMPPAAAAATMPPLTIKAAETMPTWCEVIEKDADPAVVTDATMRDAIAKTGLPWRVRDRASGIEMLLVPPGQFVMGKSPGDAEAMANEVPAHGVTITKAYYLGRYEVTRAQWDRVMAGSPTRQDRDGSVVKVTLPDGSATLVGGGSELRDQDGNVVSSEVTTRQGAGGAITITTTAVSPTLADAAPGADPQRTPVSRVGWESCAEFGRKTGLRLPTEAEWEYACRGGGGGSRYGALDDIAWHRGNAEGMLQPVGVKAANALGFHDMIGNAWEWVNDWYADYTRQAKTDPVGPATGTSRIIRGSYLDEEGGFCRASLRYDVNLFSGGAWTGFRVARHP